MMKTDFYLQKLRLTSLIFISLMAGFTDAFADDFAVIATPPRFEITGKPGTVTRQVIETVSYTHLDVYKRQIGNTAAQ